MRDFLVGHCGDDKLRDYSKVHTAFWTSASIRELSEDGRALALYLLTCPHGTIAGVFRAPDGYVCEDMQWGSERVKKGFQELFDNGFAKRCETTKWVWIVNHLRWNTPDNPNQIKAINKVADTVPSSCGWLSEFHVVAQQVIDATTFKPSKRKGNPSETVPEPFRNQEQEQEQEQEFIGASCDAPDEPEKGKPKTKRATRLADSWVLPKSWGEWALQERGDLDADSVRHEAECFADYWRGAPGQKGTKLDWEATWRNWIRRADGQKKRPASPAGLGVFV